MGGSHQYEIGLLQVPPPKKSSSTALVGTIIGVLTLLAVVLIIGLVVFRRSKQHISRLPIDNSTVAFNNMETAEGHLQRLRINCEYLEYSSYQRE